MSLAGLENCRPDNPDAEEWMVADIYKTRAQIGTIWIWAVACMCAFIVIWKLG